MINLISLFLKVENWQYLAFAIPCGVVLLGITIWTIIILRKRSRALKNNKKIAQENAIRSEPLVIDDSIVNYLGGLDNILRLELKGNTRLFVKINDFKIVDKEKIKSLNIRILEMSDKLVLVNEDIRPIYESLKSAKGE